MNVFERTRDILINDSVSIDLFTNTYFQCTVSFDDKATLFIAYLHYVQ